MNPLASPLDGLWSWWRLNVQRLPDWQIAYTVRSDWPDGTHDFSHLTRSRTWVERHLRGDQRFWQRGPLTPRLFTVVQISARDFDLHRRRTKWGAEPCRSPACPSKLVRDVEVTG